MSDAGPRAGAGRIDAWLRGALVVPPVLAAVVAAQLAAEFLVAYRGGLARGLFCGTGAGCEQVAAHPSALWFGYPLAGWGLALQLVLIAAALGALCLRAPERRALLALGTLLSSGGTLFGLWLVRVMWVEVGAWCGGCLVVHALTATAALGFASALARSPGPLRWSALLPGRAAHERDEDTYFRTLIKVLGGLVLAAALGITWVAIATPLREVRAWGLAQVEEFHALRAARAPRVDMARFDDQPWQGSEQASVSVAVVGDFECSQCRALAHTLDDLRARWPGALRTCFVNAPLGAACNPALTTDLHPHACGLAARAECAAEQGRFAAFHRLLFDELAPNDARTEVVDARLSELGLDLAAFQACLDEGRGAAAVASDLALCRELGLTTTPSIVIDGYPKLGSVHPWMLRAMLEPLLAERADGTRMGEAR